MISPDEFKASMALFASGITVLTWDETDSVQGITVSAFSSLSLNPPLVLFCIDKKAYVNPLMREKKYLAVNILASAQSDMAWRFAGADRSGLDESIHRDNRRQLPYLHGALCNLSVCVQEIITGGDHDIFIAAIEESARFPERAPLLYHNSRIFSV